jgi:hypothetical protein
VVDLLEDPSAEALVNWLTEYPGAQVICRERDLSTPARPGSEPQSSPTAGVGGSIDHVWHDSAPTDWQLRLTMA